MRSAIGMLVLAGLSGATTVTAVAQDGPSRPRFGGLVQAVGDFQPERPAGAEHNTFRIRTARLYALGRLDDRLDYLLMGDLVRSPVLVEARIGWSPTPAVTVYAGRFKVPTTAEYHMGASGLDFIYRSMAVTALAAGRQAGVAVRAGRPAGWNAQAAVANGTTVLENDDGGFAWLARLGRGDPRALVGPSPEGLSLGVSGAYNDHRALGRELTGGADLRYGRDGWVAATDWLWERARVGGTEFDSWGGHVTAGRRVHAQAQVIVRYERFTDAGVLTSRRVLAGLNAWLAQGTVIQVNWVVDPDDAAFDRHQFLVNLQMLF